MTSCRFFPKSPTKEQQIQPEFSSLISMPESFKNPPILIFDEATSALDNESEKVVQDSLEKLAKNRTTIVIAHRLSTIRNAEKILVLTEEGIAEEGTHQELMEKQGIYEKLYQMQFQS